MAVNNLMAPAHDIPSGAVRAGQRSYRANVILVARPIALIVQVLLGVVSALALLLLSLNWRRKSCLYANPDSISSIASLATRDKAVMEDFRGCDTASDKELKNRLRNRHFRLKTEVHGDTHTTILTSDGLPDDPRREVSRSVDLDQRETHVDPKPVRPAVLSLPVGVSFMLVLLSSIACLGCIKGLTGARNGIYPG